MVLCDPVGVSRLHIFFVLGESATCSMEPLVGSGCDSSVSFVTAQLVSNSAEKIIIGFIKCSLKNFKLLGKVTDGGQHNRIWQGHNNHFDIS